MNREMVMAEGDETPRPSDGGTGPLSPVVVYFNPFAYTIEMNNHFLSLGYEPMPMHIPRSDRGE